MSSARRSARLASSQESSSPKQDESPKPAAGSKRKSELSQSPSTKRSKKSTSKQQTTIEESMDVDTNEESKSQPPANVEETTSGDAAKQSEDSKPNGNSTEDQPSQDNNASADKQSAQKNGTSAEKTGESKAEHKVEDQPPQPKAESDSKEHIEHKSQDQPAEASRMDDTGSIKPTNQPDTEEKSNTNGDSAVESHARDDETPAEILEKGIIYFFIRGRVGIEDPSQVDDIARSYMILRPIPHGAKLGDGPIGSGGGKCRLLALPKKVLPVSGKDKFMVFVENAKTTFSELKDSFLSASDYSTQTAGTRHTPSANPIAEGIYAITTTGRESHLAYMLTIPSELGDVQKDIGLREQGSFVTSAKNPQYAGPANTNLPQGPDFPKEILDEFRNLRWCPLQPKFLDYENCQFLLIGESSGIDKALEPQGQDSNGVGEKMKEEMEKLEGEDEIRIKHLKGDDAIFTDLGVSKKDYNLQTTWES